MISRITRIIITVCLTGISLQTLAQVETNNLSLLKDKATETDFGKQYHFARGSNNELEFIFSNLFLFYKRFVSSQDISSCSFTPSCSVYAVQAIKSQGLVSGAINFFDRYSRCNSLSPGDYPRDPEKNLLIDPVRNHAYEKTYHDTDLDRH